MKRILSFFLMIVCLSVLPGLVCADNTPWPVLDPEWSAASLRSLSDSDMRHQAYFGPGKDYATAGAFKPGHVKQARLLFREGDYSLVELDYPNVGKRCVYFKNSALRETSADSVTLTSYPAKTDTVLIPVMGPGNDYDIFTQTMPPEWKFVPEDYDLDSWAEMIGYYDIEYFELLALVSKYGGSTEIAEATTERVFSVVLQPGTQVNVLFETNGWAYAELTCALGLIRAWLPSRYLLPTQPSLTGTVLCPSCANLPHRDGSGVYLPFSGTVLPLGSSV